MVLLSRETTTKNKKEKETTMEKSYEKIYKVVSENIIRSIEKIVERRRNGEEVNLPWDKGFSYNPKQITKNNRNPLTKTFYKNTNAITTEAFRLANGFNSRFFFSKKGFLGEGGRVQREQFTNYTVILFPIIKEEETEVKGKIKKKKSFLGLRYYQVWNLDQMEDSEMKRKFQQIEKDQEENDVIDEKDKINPIEEAEIVIDSYKSREKVKVIFEMAKCASYNVISDRVLIPSIDNWKSPNHFYSTFFHELVHSTGHSKRLNREFGLNFGSETYSKEELVAEIGSSFIMANLGIEKTITDNSLAYISSWLKVLKNDSSFLTYGLIQGRKASDLILNINQSND
jgi:antirestriction protein ArdC